ncbi:MAG: flavin monoamine oxidase family protein [Ardenticatenaceae bacterium]
MSLFSFWRKEAKRVPFFEGVPTGAAQDRGKVIVVGAGAAGLTAARVLHAHGCEVLVLEGRERMGGRLNTINVGGGMADEGGNWIHGVPENPLYDLVQEAGFTTTEDNFIHPLRLKTFDKTTGRGVNSLKMFYFLFRTAKALGRFASEGITATHPESNFAERVEKEVAGVWGAKNKRYFRYLMRMIVDLTAAEKSELLHPNGMALNPDYEDGKDFVIKGGYSRLIERLAGGLHVRLGTTVEAIRYDNDGVEVVTSKGAFQGSHVIVTVPLGVLKAKTIAFDPPLPAQKVKAIENIGVGNVEKIILKFETPFWRSSPQQPRSVFYVSDTIGDFPAFIDATRSAGCPMLVAFLSGDQARRLMEDSEPFIEQATQILRAIFPASYQAPTAVHVTNWGKDPFSRGSYSTSALATSAEDYDHFAQPIAGRVLFAGEATYRERAGFVEGAMGSGIREARRILGRKVDLVLKPQ